MMKLIKTTYPGWYSFLNQKVKMSQCCVIGYFLPLGSKSPDTAGVVLKCAHNMVSDGKTKFG